MTFRLVSAGSTRTVALDSHRKYFKEKNEISCSRMTIKVGKTALLKEFLQAKYIFVIIYLFFRLTCCEYSSIDF